jgi:hypothetical protein
MDLVAELQRLEHQLELADRRLAPVRDQPTTMRLLAFGEDIKARIDRLKPAILEGRHEAPRVSPLGGCGAISGAGHGLLARPSGGSKACPQRNPEPEFGYDDRLPNSTKSLICLVWARWGSNSGPRDQVMFSRRPREYLAVYRQREPSHRLEQAERFLENDAGRRGGCGGQVQCAT